MFVMCSCHLEDLDAPGGSQRLPGGYQRLTEASRGCRRCSCHLNDLDAPAGSQRLPGGYQRLPKASRACRRLAEDVRGCQSLPVVPRGYVWCVDSSHMKCF